MVIVKGKWIIIISRYHSICVEYTCGALVFDLIDCFCRWIWYWFYKIKCHFQIICRPSCIFIRNAYRNSAHINRAHNIIQSIWLTIWHFDISNSISKSPIGKSYHYRIIWLRNGPWIFRWLAGNEVYVILSDHNAGTFDQSINTFPVSSTVWNHTSDWFILVAEIEIVWFSTGVVILNVCEAEIPLLEP